MPSSMLKMKINGQISGLISWDIILAAKLETGIVLSIIRGQIIYMIIRIVLMIRMTIMERNI